MNFQPSDYLNNLNLDLESISPNTDVSNNDLDLFSKSDFFDLDVFAGDSFAPNKAVVQQHRASVGQPQEADRISMSFSPEINALDGTSEDSANSRASIELSNEDKRRRNTAASARFRIKKKLKEQQMEQRAKELQDKVNDLEKKVKTLEMENRCLKNLILQKNDKKNDDLLESIKKKSAHYSTNTFEFTN